MSRLPAAGEDGALDAIITTSTTYYLSLHSGDPGTTGASEITGGSYARQSIVFGTNASAGSKASTTGQSFTGMPAEGSGCPYFGVWSASTSGTFEWGGTTSGLSGAISAGDTVTFAIGAVTASES